MLWSFLPIALLVTVTPETATANVIRSAMRGGRRAGVLTIAGNSVGVLAWGLLSVLGISALPQFVGARGDVLPTTLLMVALIVSFDFAWYTTLAVLVSRARRAFTGSRLARRLERITGAALIALGARVALEHR